MTGSRKVRIQLTVLAVLGTITISVVAFRYAQLMQVIGWGRYQVTTTLPATGGLSHISLVTFRGVSVGKVTELELVPQGVRVHLSVEHSAAVPAGVVARVHSMNAIGEQFLDLSPEAGPIDGSPRTGVLDEGDVVPAARDAIPVEAGSVLANANSLITSVDPKQLRTTVDEVATAFGGRQEDIGTLIDNGSALITTANENLGVTKQLLKDLGPVLGTQVAIAPDVVATSRNLDALTQTLAGSDADLRAVVAQGPAVLDQLTRVVQGVQPTLPVVLANLATTGQVLTVYDAGARQLLVLLPATYASLLSTYGDPGYTGGRLWFRINLNDPVGCRKGFVKPHRGGKDTSDPTSIADAWCKESPTSQLAVRGARNSPCPNGAGRSATAAGCGLTFPGPVKVTSTAYDPETGDYVGSNGTRYRVVAPRGGGAPDSSDFLSALSGD